MLSQATPLFSWTSGHSCQDDSALVSLWIEAIRAYEEETKRPFPLQHTFESTDDIYAHVQEYSQNFREFRENESEWMRALRLKVEPVALVIQTLSGALGDAVTLVSGSKVIADTHFLTRCNAHSPFRP